MRKNLKQIRQEIESEKEINCPLCGRLLDDKADRHHLIPDSRGGKGTTRLHKICHRKIHATFTEKELEKYYHTVERLLENEEIQKFVKWVQKKPFDYYDGSVETVARRNKRW